MAKDILVLFLSSESAIAGQLSSSLVKGGVKCQLKEFSESLEEISPYLTIGDIAEDTKIFALLPSELLSSDTPTNIKNFLKELHKIRPQIHFCITDELQRQKIAPEFLWDYFYPLSSDTFQKSVRDIIELINPESHRRSEILNRLKNPSLVDDFTIQELRQFTLNRYEPDKDPQAVQCAAIAGLEKIGGSRAVLILTERVINRWGMKSINRAMKGLNNLSNDGGILALTATILYDPRFYFERIEILINACKKMNEEEIVSQLSPFAKGSIYSIREDVQELFQLLESVHINDISYGAKLARFRKPVFTLFDKLPLSGALESIGAVLYAEKRLPGLDRSLQKVNSEGGKVYELLK